MGKIFFLVIDQQELHDYHYKPWSNSSITPIYSTYVTKAVYVTPC